MHAHEGHDHGSQAPAAPATASPRGEAHSDKFELVAVAQAETLTLYLDDYRSNAPVDKAIVEIETPDGPKTATPLGNGIYRLDAPFLAKGGHIDLIVTVTAGDNSDILSVSIDIPQSQTAADNSGLEMVRAADAFAVDRRIRRLRSRRARWSGHCAAGAARSPRRRSPRVLSSLAMSHARMKVTTMPT